MKRALLIALLCYSSFTHAQTTYRDDAGLRGDAGATSGFFEAYGGTNYPGGPATWWHLLDIRHSNPSNNYAMQFAGSFFDQNVWVRKTNNNAAQSWSRVIVETDGKVGINTLTPQVPFHVIGNALMEDNLKIIAKDFAWAEGLTVIKPVGWGGIRFTRLDPASGNYFGNWAIGYTSFSGNDFSISNSNTNGQNDALFHISSATLNVGIGTANPNEKLAVNGKIRAKEIKVETANWPDYVFDGDYKKASLSELEKYINVNKHLPNVPTAKEVENNGVELGEMNKILLKKVEEITLHLIEKDKEINQLKAGINELNAAFKLINEKLASVKK